MIIVSGTILPARRLAVRRAMRNRSGLGRVTGVELIEARTVGIGVVGVAAIRVATDGASVNVGTIVAPGIAVLVRSTAVAVMPGKMKCVGVLDGTTTLCVGATVKVGDAVCVGSTVEVGVAGGGVLAIKVGVDEGGCGVFEAVAVGTITAAGGITRSVNELAG